MRWITKAGQLVEFSRKADRRKGGLAYPDGTRDDDSTDCAVGIKDDLKFLLPSLRQVLDVLAQKVIIFNKLTRGDDFALVVNCSKTLDDTRVTCFLDGR